MACPLSEFDFSLSAAWNDWLEVWSLWSQGQEVKECSLWGTKILILGRYGKLTTFISALVIIIDIVGRERIAAFGTSLDVASRIVYSSIERWSTLGRNKIIDFYNYMIQDSESRRYFHNYIIGLQYRQWRATIIFIVSIAIFGIFATFNAFLINVIHTGTSEGASPTSGLIAGLAFSLVVVLSTIMLIFLLYLLIPAIFIFIQWQILNSLFITRMLYVKPLVWIFDHPHFVLGARIISLAFLLFGFHFDYLAS